MAKKRRTKHQKIISQLRRELKKQQPLSSVEKEKTTGKKQRKSTEDLSLSYKPSQIKKKTKEKKETEVSLYNYDPGLIKKDLFKTLYLSIIFFAILGLFYWYFELEGNLLVNKLAIL